MILFRRVDLPAPEGPHSTVTLSFSSALSLSTPREALALINCTVNIYTINFIL